MIRPRRNMRLLGVAGALCALSAAPAAHAQLVTSIFTQNGSLFHYNYTINNNTPTDFVDITLSLTPGTNVLNLVAPVGFTPAYDPGSGDLDFLAGTNAMGGPQDFTPGSTFSGFAFDSPLTPQTLPFTASDQNLTPTPGTTLAPRAAAVPESGTLALALLAGPGLLLIARRRRAPFIPARPTQGDQTA